MCALVDLKPRRAERRSGFDRYLWMATIAAVIALAVLPGLAAAAPAAPTPSASAKGADADRALRLAVADRFDVLELRSGPVLRPRGVTRYHAVEFAGAKVAVDGETLSGDALRRRLGEDYDLITRLASLGEASRNELLHAAGAEVASAAPAGAAPAGTPPAGSATPAETPVPEASEEPQPRHPSRADTEAKVSIGSSSTVAAGEVAHDVVVIGGAVDVQGEVLGDAVAVGGSVEVNGRVTGNVVAVGGGVTLGPRAEVLGDVSSVGGHIERDPAAKVVGQVSEVALGPMLRLGALRHGRWQSHASHDVGSAVLGGVSRLVRSVLTLGVLALLVCLVVLLARAPLERVGEKASADPWRAGLTGLAAQVLFLPLAFLTGLVLIISIIGIPLLVVAIFVVPVALAVLGFLGYAAVASRLGRWAEGRFGWHLGSPYLVALVGVALIQMWTVAARLLDWGFFPMGMIAFLGLFLGFLVQYAAWTVGFGAVLLTRFGTQQQWRKPAPVAAAETPVETLVAPPEAAAPAKPAAGTEAGPASSDGESVKPEPPA